MFRASTINTTPVVSSKTVRSFAAGLYMAVAAFGLTATSAHATLIEQDLNAVGDKLITLDTVTGLEWLDVTSTLNLSYNQAELTAFVTAQGFRHANITDVVALYTNVGVTNFSSFFAVSNFSGVQELLAKLGCTASCGSDNPLQWGLADLSSPSPTLAQSSSLLSNVPGASALAYMGFSPPSKEDWFGPGVGNYLIRAAIESSGGATVSEPPSSALLVGGISALAWFRRRRRTG